MALQEKKAEAIRMRRKGASYSQIKSELEVSKSTLSLWLRDLPLSKKRVRELRDFSEVRIEKYRQTRKKARELRWAQVRGRAAKDIGTLSKRDLLIAGLFLYWGEGTKTATSITALTNTDPSMMRFFIEWLHDLGIPKEKLRVYIHLYSDMDISAELRYWSKTLGLSITAFRRPYVKDSKRSGISYQQRFTHGTCNVIYGNRDISEYILQALEVLRSRFAGGKQI